MKRFCEQQEKIDKFCDHIRLGMSLKSVCAGMCISVECIYKYIQVAERQLAVNPDAESPEIHFLHCYKKAEDEFETHHLANIKNFADNGDWKASAWLLERRRQQDYVIRTDLGNFTPDKITINMDVKRVLSDDNDK